MFLYLIALSLYSWGLKYISKLMSQKLMAYIWAHFIFGNIFGIICYCALFYIPFRSKKQITFVGTKHFQKCVLFLFSCHTLAQAFS